MPNPVSQEPRPFARHATGSAIREATIQAKGARNIVTPPFQSLPQRITTTRLILERFKRSDALDLFDAAFASTDEMYPFMPWCHPEYSLEDAHEAIQTALSNWALEDAWAFTIRVKTTGEFIGGCGLNTIDEHRNANLGYWIKSTEVGRGYASEATRALVAYGLYHLQLVRIEIMISTLNSASMKVAEKSGATYEGIARNRLFLHDTAYDAHLFSFIPADFPDG